MLSFFFNDTATTEIYTLSLHDALPICQVECGPGLLLVLHLRAVVALRHPLQLPELLGVLREVVQGDLAGMGEDRKSTRLNSSHANISYAVFCLKKKKI